jgi:hypothetical protein
MMQARQKKFLAHAPGERKNCAAFFSIIWTDHTEAKGFLALSW